jgi:hypothetical protein
MARSLDPALLILGLADLGRRTSDPPLITLMSSKTEEIMPTGKWVNQRDLYRHTHVKD